MQLLDKVVVPVVCTDNALVQTRSSMSFPQVQLLDKVVVPVVCHVNSPGPVFHGGTVSDKVVVTFVCNDKFPGPDFMVSLRRGSSPWSWLFR